mmetsp:Transcript_92825/g.298523  ORF Transcript_92825/g.298523 Transcript_92825/m.298523 type:complete len:236 (-) Transcript_92825:18-725(-)
MKMRPSSSRSNKSSFRPENITCSIEPGTADSVERQGLKRGPPTSSSTTSFCRSAMQRTFDRSFSSSARSRARVSRSRARAARQLRCSPSRTFHSAAKLAVATARQASAWLSASWWAFDARSTARMASCRGTGTPASGTDGSAQPSGVAPAPAQMPAAVAAAQGEDRGGSRGGVLREIRTLGGKGALAAMAPAPAPGATAGRGGPVAPAGAAPTAGTSLAMGEGLDWARARPAEVD